MTTPLRVVPQPLGLSFRDWADTVVGYNVALLNQLSSDMEWHEFAHRLALIYSETPRPEQFGDWESWAEALRTALQF